MESHHQSSQENTEQQVNQDQKQERSTARSQQVRSYECTFCKRGFSNAQALGGHMNIHRKQKAKLKHSSSSNDDQPQQSPLLEPNKWPPWILDQNKNIDDDACKRSKTHVEEIHQLPLFVDKQLNEDHLVVIQQQQQQPNSHQVHGSLEKDLSSSEPDLELRLGPDPQDSSPVTGAKRFF